MKQIINYSNIDEIIQIYLVPHYNENKGCVHIHINMLKDQLPTYVINVILMEKYELRKHKTLDIFLDYDRNFRASPAINALLPHAFICTS